MQKIKVIRIVNASVARVWASWDDFANIADFNPGVSSSRLLSEQSAPTAQGARRECELADGKNWLREKVVQYEPQSRMKIEVYESSLPIDSMHAALDFKELAPELTQVTMTSEFEPKMGALGKVMAPLMKRRFRLMLEALLTDNAAYVENGRFDRQAA